METKKRHILFFCSWYPNPDDKSNGIFIKRHAQSLSLHHHVTVVFAKSITTLKEAIHLKNEEENLEEYLYFYPKLSHNMPVLGAVQKFLNLKRAYLDVLDRLPERNFDIIHVNTIFPAAIPALSALKRYPSAKLFITEHWTGYYPEDGSYKGNIVTRFTKQLVSKAHGIFVISERLRQSMLNHGLKNSYHFIHNTVDVDVFKPLPINTGNQAVLKILHVSALAERQKNISTIIAVAARLHKANKPFHLTMIGDNPSEIDTHKKRVAEHNLEQHITFTGFKSPPEIAEYMNQSDVFLLMSHFEGEPVVVLEALACGLPVISTNVGEIKNMIAPDMGIVLVTGSAEECSDILLQYKRGRFSNKTGMSRYISERHSPEAVCRQISQFYNL